MAEALAIPHPQPSDVKSPIPGDSSQDDLFAQLEAQAAATPAPAPSPAPNASPEVPPVGATPAPASAVNPQDIAAAQKEANPGPNVAAVDDLFAQLDSFAQAQKIKDAPVKEGGEGAPVFARLIANIGKEPETQRQLLQRQLGLDYDTKVQDDAVWFKKKGEEFFMRMDPQEWGSASEFLKDMTVDIAPDIAEGLVASTVAAMIARAGGVVGAAAGSPGGPGGLAAGGITGFGVGLVAGVPAGGAIAAQGRSSLANALGAHDQVDLKKEAAINSLSSILGFGVSRVVRKPAAAILDKVASALGTTKMARVSQMAKVREGIEEFSKEAGLPVPTRAVAPGAALGREIESALDIQEAKLGKQVGLVKQKATQVAGNNALPVSQFQSRAKEILENEGVTFDPQKGFAILPADYQKLKPFGDETGGVLKRIVDDYNMTLRGNGMKMNQIFNNLDFYKNEAGFQKNLPDAANTTYQRLRGALREDRDKALLQVLPADSPERKFAETAFGDFKENIDEIRKLQKLANKSPEKFADSLIAPKESARVLQLKQVLGPDSDAFSNVKSAWYSKIIQKSVDPETGIVVGSTLKKELDKYGPDVLNELMTPAQQNTLKALATQAEKIKFVDLVQNPGGSAFFKDFVRANINGVSTTEAKVRVAFSLFGSNKKVMQYLTNDGLLDLAKDIKDPQARSRTLKAAEWMAKIMRVSETKKNAKGIEMLKPPIDVGTMAGIINAMEQNVDEGMPDYLQRRKSQLNELRQEHGLPIDNPTEGE